MFLDIIEIAILCIFIGGASIPVSFTINENPFVVWTGNALGSIISAIVVIYIGNRITDKQFMKKVSKYRIGKKVTIVFNQEGSDPKAKKAESFINKHGLKLFALVCPIFPGVLVSTAIVYALRLNKREYIHWMLAGVFFVSGFYVFSYWAAFVKT